ncbi:putative proline-tRNA ligase [Smittium mucronatum]|uniref:proline--tRNA ligase n=1 Tax=Smittium mucronatum TaxID=133383 RepID=A0A1R0H154_9FUNG|nr:putative proline-tRNA ligase [Smittium mucronatum]
MSDIQDIIIQLTELGLEKPVVSHDSVETVELWSEALEACIAAEAALESQLDYVLTKCLILKPKQPKSAEPIQVFIIAKADTTFSMTNLGKDLGMKELRFANDDVLTTIFNTSKGNVSPFALSNVPADKLPSVTIILDQSLVSEDLNKDIAFHPFKNDKTVFISSVTLKSYLDKLVGPDGYKVIDLSKYAASEAKPSAPVKKAPQAEQKPAQAAEEVSGGTKLGLDVKKDDDFSRWYQQVLTRSEMLDYYDISGCYIIRPWAYHVWQTIQEYFDAKIKTMRVKNCYFPMFVSARALEQEKDHIEGFAPEVAWVTKAGSSDLEEPIAIRPTSETVMYPYFSKWIRSHRDLPLRLNQWCSVVRWEFKNPQPFLRTREFLWQEGHCAYINKEGADTEARRILTYYKAVYEYLLAVPMIDGIKSEKEKFAGGLYTTTIEGFIPSTGRGIQAGTSHNLGQSFSKMFNVVVEDPNSPSNSGNEPAKLNVWQTSWGLSTRTIGVMVMVHGDDKGLVMPPRVSEIQVIVIPTGLTVKHSASDRQTIYKACSDLVSRLIEAGIRAEDDLRENYTPGFKYNHWELKGVPIRLEIGPKDLDKNSALSVRRDTFAKSSLSLDNIETTISELLEQIQNDMFAKATKDRDAGLKLVLDWDDFVTALNNKCICLIPWCNTTDCEDQIKDRSSRAELGDEPQDEKAPSMGAKSLCIPFDQPTNPPIEQGVTKCIQCGNLATVYGLFGRSY